MPRPIVVLMLAAVLAVALAAGTAVAAEAQQHTGAASGRPASSVLTYTTDAGSWTGEVIQLLWEPRIFLFKGFLSKNECEHLMDISEQKLNPNVVVDRATGKQSVSQVRTSTGTFLRYAQDAVVDAVEQRVAAVTQLPRDNQEGMQILRYKLGQEYKAHFDWFSEAVKGAEYQGGQRTVTVLMYLTTPEEGGETLFPSVKEEYKVKGEGWSECARRGFAYKPQMGDALLFHHLRPDGTEDPGTLHASCPVVKGVKWSATKWIRTGIPIHSIERINNAWRGCTDGHPKCAEYAARGDCDRHVGWMDNHCKLSCNFCNATETSGLLSKVATTAQSDAFTVLHAASKAADTAHAAARAAANAAAAEPGVATNAEAARTADVAAAADAHVAAAVDASAAADTAAIAEEAAAARARDQQERPVPSGQAQQ